SRSSIAAPMRRACRPTTTDAGASPRSRSTRVARAAFVRGRPPPPSTRASQTTRWSCNESAADCATQPAAVRSGVGLERESRAAGREQNRLHRREIRVAVLAMGAEVERVAFTQDEALLIDADLGDARED